MQRGQVFAGFYRVAGAVQDLRDGILAQRFQPQLLDLLELLAVRVGGKVLVVVVQAEEGEDLVDRLDQRRRRWLRTLIPPRRCR